MKNKLLSKITSEQLIQDFQELGSAHKIAAKYQINVATVYTAFKIINYDCRVRQDVTAIVSKEILEEAYARLGTLKAVGRELKIDPDSVKRYMEQFNLDYTKQIIYNCDHDFFSRDNEKSFYIAGFIAADGCVKDRKSSSGNRRYEIAIGLSKEDKSFLETLRQTMKAETPIKDFLVKNSKRNPKWNDTWKSDLVITSQKMCEDLKRFNIVPRKSLIYTLPEWMKTHPLRHHFIRGYNDGDGSFYIPKLKDGRTSGQVYFSMRGTIEFLKDIQNIIQYECRITRLARDDIRISSGHGCLEYGGNGVVGKIADYLYKDATIYLQRKYDIAIKADHIKCLSGCTDDLRNNSTVIPTPTNLTRTFRLKCNICEAIHEFDECSDRLQSYEFFHIKNQKKYLIRYGERAFCIIFNDKLIYSLMMKHVCNLNIEKDSFCTPYTPDKINKYLLFI